MKITKHTFDSVTNKTHIYLSGESLIDENEKYEIDIYIYGDHTPYLSEYGDNHRGIQKYCRQFIREGYAEDHSNNEDGIDYNGPRCLKCLRLLNDYECKDCGKKHGAEYKNTSICVECYGG